MLQYLSYMEKSNPLKIHKQFGACGGAFNICNYPEEFMIFCWTFYYYS